MEELAKEIAEQLQILEEMIEKKYEKEKIEKQRRQIDKLLTTYLKDL